LAVSGLHVGIVFWLIALVFGFLQKQKSGRIFFMILSVSILWFYAFITGLSPSVMRASAMFSIVVIGENLHRKSNIYNSLAASAFILLLINPNNLYDIGFQLSYSAVFGIVFLQPKLEKLIFVKPKFIVLLVAELLFQ
jgi:competence protein ComEC